MLVQKNMCSDIDVHIGKRLRARRRQLGLTQIELAAKVCVRFQQIQKYECADNRISAARLWQLAVALDVDMNYFYSGLPRDLEQLAIEPESKLAKA